MILIESSCAVLQNTQHISVTLDTSHNPISCLTKAAKQNLLQLIDISVSNWKHPKTSNVFGWIRMRQREFLPCLLPVTNDPVNLLNLLICLLVEKHPIDAANILCSPFFVGLKSFGSIRSESGCHPWFQIWKIYGHERMFSFMTITSILDWILPVMTMTGLVYGCLGLWWEQHPDVIVVVV
jgi:hypothetical protein